MRHGVAWSVRSSQAEATCLGLWIRCQSAPRLAADRGRFESLLELTSVFANRGVVSYSLMRGGCKYLFYWRTSFGWAQGLMTSKRSPSIILAAETFPTINGRSRAPSGSGSFDQPRATSSLRVLVSCDVTHRQGER